MISEYIVKIYYRIVGLIKVLIWKLLYTSRFIVGKKTVLYPHCKVMIEHNGRIEIGYDCFFNMYCSFNCLGNIKIGNHCTFGENVKIYDHNHRHELNDIPFKKQGYNIGVVHIGDNVWIGSDVIILSGVNVGSNVVIAAGSIVTKDIPDNTVFIQKRVNL